VGADDLVTPPDDLAAGGLAAGLDFAGGDAHGPRPQGEGVDHGMVGGDHDD
jgi:hypothetical protein